MLYKEYKVRGNINSIYKTITLLADSADHMAGRHTNNFTNEDGRSKIHSDCIEGLIRLTFSRPMRVSMIIIYIYRCILFMLYIYIFLYIYGNV